MSTLSSNRLDDVDLAKGQGLEDQTSGAFGSKRDNIASSRENVGNVESSDINLGTNYDQGFDQRNMNTGLSGGRGTELGKTDDLGGNVLGDMNKGGLKFGQEQGQKDFKGGDVSGQMKFNEKDDVSSSSSLGGNLSLNQNQGKSTLDSQKQSKGTGCCSSCDNGCSCDSSTDSGCSKCGTSCTCCSAGETMQELFGVTKKEVMLPIDISSGDSNFQTQDKQQSSSISNTSSSGVGAENVFLSDNDKVKEIVPLLQQLQQEIQSFGKGVKSEQELMNFEHRLKGIETKYKCDGQWCGSVKENAYITNMFGSCRMLLDKLSAGLNIKGSERSIGGTKHERTQLGITDNTNKMELDDIEKQGKSSNFNETLSQRDASRDFNESNDVRDQQDMERFGSDKDLVNRRA